jgi:hypothetical protein
MREILLLRASYFDPARDWLRSAAANPARAAINSSFIDLERLA